MAVSNAIPATGEPLPEFRAGPFKLEDTRLYAAASLDDNPLHTDPAAALAAGLQGPIVHGMLLMGMFEQAVAAWRTDMRIVRLQTTFLRPVGLGDSVAIGGRVAKVTRGHDGVDVVLRLLVRTGADALACVGEAAGRIPAA